jgi:hypothetical protein
MKFIKELAQNINLAQSRNQFWSSPKLNRDPKRKQPKKIYITGPKLISRTRPLRLGCLFAPLTGPWVGPWNEHHSSQSYGYLFISVDQNPSLVVPPSNPSHSFTNRATVSERKRAKAETVVTMVSTGGVAREPFHRRMHSPERIAAEWPCGGALSRSWSGHASTSTD